MNTTLLDIKKIQIDLHTNDTKNRLIELKGSVFGFGNNYPFYSTNVLYSEEALNELTNYDPIENRRTFFDIDMFQSFLEQSARRSQTTTTNIQQCNVKIMLDILFKISYPVPSSVSLATPVDCPIITKDSFITTIRETFQKPVHTHISSSSKKYTVLAVKWANTIQTNPDYAKQIIAPLQVYKIERDKFVKTYNDKIASLTNKITSKLVIPSEGTVFKNYTKITESPLSETDKIINQLIEYVNKLQQDFIFYTYLWIMAGKIEKPEEAIPNNTNSIYEIISTSLNKLINSGNKQIIDSIFPYDTKIIKTGVIQCSIGFEERLKILDDIKKIDGYYQPLVDNSNYDRLSQFAKFLIQTKPTEGKIDGFNETNRKNLLPPTINNTNISKVISAIIDILTRNPMFTIKRITMFDNPSDKLCEYGFNATTGLYYKIQSLHKTIKSLSTLNESNISSDLQNEIKKKIESVNSDLEKQINISPLNKILEEIKTANLYITTSSKVETSQTDKSEDEKRVWTELYRKRNWYNQFSKNILEIAKSRRSTNPAIIETIGNGSQIDIDKLDEIISKNVEAGIDEINIGKTSQSEKLPTYKINIFCVLLGGEITELNRNYISCPYKSNKLASIGVRLMLGQPANPDIRRTDFVDLTDIIKKKEEEAKQKQMKNKTRKNQKEDGVVEKTIKQAGYANYNDQNILQGIAAINPGLPNVEEKKEKKEEEKKKVQTPLSNESEQFIDEKFNIIKNYESANLKNSSFEEQSKKVFEDVSDLKDHIEEKYDANLIKNLNEAIEFTSNETSDNNEKKTKLLTSINEYKLKFTSEKNKANINRENVRGDDEKQQKNYLKLYYATIMENLFTAVENALNSVNTYNADEPASGSPRGMRSMGGSKKRITKRIRRKTLRKKQRV